jgi:hypothetical protein
MPDEASPARAWSSPPCCAYCAEREAEVVCGGEHDGYIGQELCFLCYYQICMEEPVLPGAGRLVPEEDTP